MEKRILRLACDPFFVDLEDRPVALFVNPPTGDILMDSAVMYAWKGLAFSLAPGSSGFLLRLQYRDTVIDVGWTDAIDAASWVDAVNRFLESKRLATEANGKHKQAAPTVTS